MGDIPGIDAVEAFLDAADAVLNSNTLLVALPLRSADPVADVGDFIRSGGLQEALFAADITRGWFNLHRFGAGDTLRPLPDSFRSHFRLTLRGNHCGAAEYLQAMLRADPMLGSFISFHQRRKSPEEARKLTGDLLGWLFAAREPSLTVFEPDFLEGSSPQTDEAYYFEGKGCDNAALLARRASGYLLLTNGAP